jgi:aromatic amino acid aminotransferase I
MSLATPHFSVYHYHNHYLSWHKSIATFCNPEEGILAEEWTYPSAIAFALP